MAKSPLWMVVPIFAALQGEGAAQMSLWRDSTGTIGQSFDLGNGMGMWSDSRGRSGSYMDMGQMGLYQDNRGTQGQWFDLNEQMRTFQDNRGGHGMMQEMGEGMGQFQYFDQRGRMQQGTYQGWGQ